MQNMPSAGLRARVALEKHGFHTTHSLGQNFILEDVFIQHLLDGVNISPEDNILEIGPGAGVMTALLAERAKRVLSVEIDQKLAPVLEDVLAPYENTKVVFCDFMKADISALIEDNFGAEPYRVVANLPYYITADILLRLVNCERKPERIAIMVQKEAAERILSNPGEKQWCALAATLRHYGVTEVIEEVSPEMFFPIPHVMSCFIQIERYDHSPVQPKDERLYLRLIQAAFAMRRKTLANNLKQAFGLSQPQVLAVLEEAEIPEKVRGEALQMDELCRVSDALSEALTNKK